MITINILLELPPHDVTRTVENGNSRGENVEWSDDLPGATPHKVCIVLWENTIPDKFIFFQKLSVTVGVHWESINLNYQAVTTTCGSHR